MAFPKLREVLYFFLHEVEVLRGKKPENYQFIIRAYNKVIGTLIESFPRQTTTLTPRKLEPLSLTDHMKKKIAAIPQILKTDPPPYTSDKKLKSHLQQKIEIIRLRNILGLGEKKIAELREKGLKTPEQLKKEWNTKWHHYLPQSIGTMLQYNPSRHIKWTYIKSKEEILTKYGGVITGSWRREKRILRDVDILFCESGNRSVDRYLKYLRKKCCNVVIYNRGDEKLSLLVQFGSGGKSLDCGRGKSGVYVKIDIFLCVPDNYYSMLLYTTGSQSFNIRMRGIARRKGLLLNQKGLFNKTTGHKINKPSDNERDIFKYLDMEYLEPPLRK
jgi:DNA polymerase/3'-5' exonuclease PolX